MQLEWESVSPTAARTKCHGYTVGTDDGGRWQTWKFVPGGPWFTVVAKDLPDERAARAAAQADLDSCPMSA